MDGSCWRHSGWCPSLHRSVLSFSSLAQEVRADHGWSKCESVYLIFFFKKKKFLGQYTLNTGTVGKLCLQIPFCVVQLLDFFSSLPLTLLGSFYQQHIGAGLSVPASNYSSPLVK